MLTYIHTELDSVASGHLRSKYDVALSKMYFKAKSHVMRQSFQNNSVNANSEICYENCLRLLVNQWETLISTDTFVVVFYSSLAQVFLSNVCVFQNRRGKIIVCDDKPNKTSQFRFASEMVSPRRQLSPSSLFTRKVSKTIFRSVLNIVNLHFS